MNLSKVKGRSSFGRKVTIFTLAKKNVPTSNNKKKSSLVQKNKKIILTNSNQNSSDRILRNRQLKHPQTDDKILNKNSKSSVKNKQTTKPTLSIKKNKITKETSTTKNDKSNKNKINRKSIKKYIKPNELKKSSNKIKINKKNGKQTSPNTSNKLRRNKDDLSQNEKISPQKHIQISDKIVINVITPFRNKHRIVEQKNYEESPLESPPILNENEEKIPIYKQALLNENKIKKKPKDKDDLYEFDSDSEKQSKTKTKRVSDKSFSIEINKNKKKKLTKIRKTRKQIKQQPNEKHETKTYDNKMNVILKNIMVKINKNKSLSPSKADKIPVIEDNARIHDKPVISNNKNEMNKSVFHYNSPDRNDDFFTEDDFSRFDNYAKFKSTPKVIIHQDILISPESDIPQKNQKSNQNINQYISPWRFDDSIFIRNPYFINIKSSALPNISQEMVLDHTFVDKFDQICKTPKHITHHINDGMKTPKYNNNEDSDITKTPKYISDITNTIRDVRKTPKQTSILDYYDGNNCDKENYPLSGSLFDNDQFVSPIKRKSPIKIPLTPKSNNNNSNIENLSDSCFGFSKDNNDDTINDNTITSQKPFRLSIKQKKIDFYLKKIDEINTIDNLPNEDNTDGGLNEEHQEDNTETIVGLFEDLKMPIKKYERKRKRRHLYEIESVEEEHENENEDYNKVKHHKKKKKNCRTIAEIKEADKWAKQFNEMCKEVDEYELEIE